MQVSVEPACLYRKVNKAAFKQAADGMHAHDFVADRLILLFAA